MSEYHGQEPTCILQPKKGNGVEYDFAIVLIRAGIIVGTAATYAAAAAGINAIDAPFRPYYQIMPQVKPSGIANER